MRNAKIHSVGVYVPERVISNRYFDELLGENVSDWLEQKVQIYERHWCDSTQSTADLAINAAQKAMENGNIQPQDVDLLIISTDTPEYISPSTASKVQYKLGLVNAGTFDLNSACAGFVTAIDVAVKYIKSDERYNTILVIGAYAMSKFINEMDKKTANLFADGAGAFVLKSTSVENEGYLASKLLTKGEFHDYMGIYAGGTYQPVSHEVIDKKAHLLAIQKKFPNELNPQIWSQLALDLCAMSEISISEVKRFFFTQININSIWETMDLLGLERDLAQTSMHHFGYTGSACIPLAFNDSLAAQKIQRGDIVFLIGSGGGLSFAAAAFRF